MQKHLSVSIDFKVLIHHFSDEQLHFFFYSISDEGFKTEEDNWTGAPLNCLMDSKRRHVDLE